LKHHVATHRTNLGKDSGVMFVMGNLRDPPEELMARCLTVSQSQVSGAYTHSLAYERRRVHGSQLNL
jgi:hypothetical protein